LHIFNNHIYNITQDILQALLAPLQHLSEHILALLQATSTQLKTHSPLQVATTDSLGALVAVD